MFVMFLNAHHSSLQQQMRISIREVVTRKVAER